MPRKIPDTLIQHAAELVQAGSKLKDAAHAIGYTPDEVSKYLRKLGIVCEQRRNWNALSEPIITLYQQGFGTTAIALKLDVPRSSASNIRDVLIRHGLMRNGSAANFQRSIRESIETKRSGTQVARKALRKRIQIAITTGTKNAAIGIGELEVATILRNFNIPFQQQVVVSDRYLIDVVVGSLAVEIKTSSTSATVSKLTLERLEHLSKSGYTLTFLVVNHTPTLLNHADDLISALNRIEGHPTTSGEYWVIKCSLEQIGTNFEVDHWSVEHRTPKRLDIFSEN